MVITVHTDIVLREQHGSRKSWTRHSEVEIQLLADPLIRTANGRRRLIYSISCVYIRYILSGMYRYIYKYVPWYRYWFCLILLLEIKRWCEKTTAKRFLEYCIVLYLQTPSKQATIHRQADTSPPSYRVLSLKSNH